MALLCALPYRPKLLILDEPFSGLDPLVRDEFMEGLLCQAGEMTILISSHELAEIDGVATHVAFLDEGKLLSHRSTPFCSPTTSMLGCFVRTENLFITEQVRASRLDARDRVPSIRTYIRASNFLQLSIAQ
jgi:ABC-type multidrug transport system ATPase subunit